MDLPAEIAKRTGIPIFLQNVYYSYREIRVQIHDVHHVVHNLLALMPPERKKEINARDEDVVSNESVSVSPTTQSATTTSNSYEDKSGSERSTEKENKESFDKAMSFSKDPVMATRLVEVARHFSYFSIDEKPGTRAIMFATSLPRDVVGIIGTYLRLRENEILAKDKSEEYWLSPLEQMEFLTRKIMYQPRFEDYLRYSAYVDGRPDFYWKEAVQKQKATPFFGKIAVVSGSGGGGRSEFIQPTMAWSEQDHAARMDFLRKLFDPIALQISTYCRQLRFDMMDFVIADQLTYTILKNTAPLLAALPDKPTKNALDLEIKNNIDNLRNLVRECYVGMNQNFNPQRYQPGGMDVTLLNFIIGFADRLQPVLEHLNRRIKVLEGSKKTLKPDSLLEHVKNLQAAIKDFMSIYNPKNAIHLMAVRQEVIVASGEKIIYKKPESNETKNIKKSK